MAVKSEYIGTEVWSRTLDRNVVIKEDGPLDDYYKLIGLGHILEEEVKPSKKNKDDSDKQGIV